MPNVPKTQHRSVRVADDDWADLDTRTSEVGTNRAAVINQLIAWYLRRDGAKLPARPPASESAAKKKP
jgi:hypothetical protein